MHHASCTFTRLHDDEAIFHSHMHMHATRSSGIYICETNISLATYFFERLKQVILHFILFHFCSYSPTPSNERRVRRRWL